MGRDKKQIKVLVLGLGNELLMDDGVGVHVIRILLQEPPIEGASIVEVGTAILHVQHLIEQAAYVIAIDAVQADGKPGTIYRFDIDQAQLNKPDSLHELGIAGVLQLIPEHNRPKTVVLGVQPERIDYGMELSHTVQAVMPRIVQITQKLVIELLSRRQEPYGTFDE